MPFKSNKQKAYLYSQQPAVTKKFAKHSKPSKTEMAKKAMQYMM